MNLRTHPLLARVLDAAVRYRQGELPVEALQQTLSAVMSALESDVPKPVRDALFEAEAQVDSARFTVDTPERPRAVASILDDLETAIDASNGDALHAS
jgi:hypothetical protein